MNGVLIEYLPCLQRTRDALVGVAECLAQDTSHESGAPRMFDGKGQALQSSTGQTRLSLNDTHNELNDRKLKAFNDRQGRNLPLLGYNSPEKLHTRKDRLRNTQREMEKIRPSSGAIGSFFFDPICGRNQRLEVGAIRSQ